MAQNDWICIVFVICVLYVFQLGKHAKQIFGKSWDFGPTGLTPPLPERWDSQKGKKKVMFILHFRLF